MHGVVIWHIGRCGSTVLGTMLDQHPSIQWENEIFNPLLRAKREGRAVPAIDTALAEVAGRRTRPIQSVEVKFLADQHPSVFGCSLEEMIEVFLSRGYSRFVILNRVNYLSRMVSHGFARGIGIGDRKLRQHVRGRQVMMTKQELTDELRRLAPFHHSIELPHDLSTHIPSLARRPVESTRLSNLVKHAFPALVDRCGGSLRGRRVLDVACNCGGFSVQAAKLGSEHVLGIDVVDHYLEQAALIKRALNLEQVHFKRLHNREVRRFFAAHNASDVLLEACWGLGAGRGTLCGFLELSVPDVPFPHANPSNPKGIFEGPQINEVNEALLAPVTPPEQGLRPGQRWLAVIDNPAEIQATPSIKSRISGLVQDTPYCYKDPRFSYTLPAWLPYLHDTRMICIFREPGLTAESIVTECRTMPYLANLEMNVARHPQPREQPILNPAAMILPECSNHETRPHPALP